MIARIDHISIAVKDYEKARRFFEDILGAVPGAHAHNRKQKFFWQIYALGDLSRLELIRPTDPNGLLDKFLQKNTSGGLHHLSLQTADIKKTQQILDQHGIPYFGYNEYGEVWKEVFIHPRDAFGVLIQIAEFHAADWLPQDPTFPKDQKWAVRKGAHGCTLRLAHPGGGKIDLELTPAEIDRLIDDLKA